MNSKTFSFVTLLLLFFSLTACQPDGAAATENPTATMPPAPTPEPTATPVPKALNVPQGEPQAIDGVLSPGEWGAAVSSPFADGSEMLLMHQDGYLYVAIRANTSEAVAGNVYLFSGDEISIHHTSAALGTGRYAQDAGGWKLTQRFDWRCRETSDSEAARNALEEFLKDEGWVSINSWMGTPNELEYKIQMPAGSFRLAANYLTAEADAVKVPWPQDLQDDTTIIMSSGLPQQLSFTPEEWVAVQLIGGTVN
jgi:hypothetical protein